MNNVSARFSISTYAAKWIAQRIHQFMNKPLFIQKFTFITSRQKQTVNFQRQVRYSYDDSIVEWYECCNGPIYNRLHAYSNHADSLYGKNYIHFMNVRTVLSALQFYT